MSMMSLQGRRTSGSRGSAPDGRRPMVWTN